MSDESYIKLVESYLTGASDASRRHHQEGARYYLAQAADAGDQIEEDEPRRFALSNVAQGAVKVHYAELSQQLARKLIRLDRKLDNTHWVITDVLSYGSSLHLSGQHLEAEDVYRQAFDLAVEIESWQQAAAASSNHAAAIAARGALDEAETWALRALEYLKRDPDLDTEIGTRAMLLQIRHAHGELPAKCLEDARSLVDEVGERMTAGHRRVLQGALDTLLKSYFDDNPDLDPREWVKSRFPELMEGPDG